MVHQRKWTTLILAAALLVCAATAGAATGTWSGTVAAVSGDDLALVGVPAHFRVAGSVTEMASGRSLAPGTLAPGTSVTLRVGDREADGRLRADRVGVEAKSPLSVTGAIGRVSDDRRHIEVQGIEIELDRSTGFSGSSSSGRLRSARDLRPGIAIAVSLAPTTAGTLRAAEVRAASGQAEVGEDQELKGVVTAIADTAWTIDSTIVTVTDQTVFEGDPGVGDFVEVKFHADASGARVADRIGIEDDAPGAEVEFRGIVEAIGPASWTISGTVVGVDATTQITGNPQMGSAVEVHAARLADGSLAAREIQLEDGTDDHGNGGGNDDGSNHDAGDDNGGSSNSGNDDPAGDDNGGSPTPTTPHGSGGHHGNGGDDTGMDN